MSQSSEIGSLAAFYGTLALVALLALWKGGAPERAGVALLLGMLALNLIGRLFGPPVYASVDLLALADDFAGFVGFAWLAYHARRFWPIWAAALQLLSLAGHFARAFEQKTGSLVYALMKSGPTYLLFLILLAGTLLHWRRVVRRRQANSSRTSDGTAKAKGFSKQR